MENISDNEKDNEKEETAHGRRRMKIKGAKKTKVQFDDHVLDKLWKMKEDNRDTYSNVVEKLLKKVYEKEIADKSRENLEHAQKGRETREKMALDLRKQITESEPESRPKEENNEHGMTRYAQIKKNYYMRDNDGTLVPVDEMKRAIYEKMKREGRI